MNNVGQNVAKIIPGPTEPPWFRIKYTPSRMRTGAKIARFAIVVFSLSLRFYERCHFNIHSIP
ncbi:hypothetical protein D3C73_1484290 [compost metagenome]